MINNEQEQLILTGDIKKLIWELSLPSIAAMVLFGFNTVSDALFIGQLLGKTALAGVALANPFIAVLLGLGYWIGTGAANILSISLGAKDDRTQQQLLGNVASLTLLLSFIFAVLVYFCAERLISLTGGQGDVHAFGVSYLKTALWATPIWVYALSLNMLVRGEGKMKQSAMMILYALLVNIIMTPFFIKVLHLGVSGAACATNIAMFLLALQGFIYYFRNKNSFQGDIISIEYNKEIIKKILVSGLPTFIFNLMALIQAVIVFYVVNYLGSEKDIAFYAATNVLYLFLMTPLYGLMRAYQPFAGINFGAKQYHRVKDGFIIFNQKGYLLILPFWFFLMIFPDMVIPIILKDTIITTQDIWNFRIYLLSLPFLPIVFIALSLFPSIDKSSHASLIVLGRQLFLYIPLVLLLPKLLGISGIYWGSSLVNIIIFIWTIVLLKKTMKLY
jgi:putative MATE family efflux protein